MINEPRLTHETGAHLPRRQAAVKTAARLSIELSSALLEHDAHLLELVRDAYRLAGVNVKVEMR